MHSFRTVTAAAAACLLATPVLAQTPTRTQAPATASAPAQVPGGTFGATSATPSSNAVLPPTASAFRPLPSQPGSNIVAQLKASDQFSTLIKGLTATNLLGLVQTTQNLTLIAPTDAAFAALPPGQLDDLMKDPAKLQGVLTYHLIATRVPLAQIQGHSAAPVTSAAQKPVTFDGSSGDVKINGQTTLQAGVPASNGVIYVVGQVLAPPA